MSAGDALAAIHTIYGIVSKVKDNKDELKCLSNRLQYIVESLEESRRRDVIRDTEYEASLSAVFGLIERVERVTRRMLRRSLGDRTWNAGEIAGDLRRLNEDVQMYLSIHTIKTLDLVQTAQSQQQTYLVTTIEEIIAKISEIDRALSGPRPQPNSATLSMAIQTTSHQTDQVPSHHSEPQGTSGSSHTGGGGGANSIPNVAALAVPSNEFDGNPSDLASQLAARDLITLLVIGAVKRSGVPQGAHLGLFDKRDDIRLKLPGSAGIDEINAALYQAGYHCPDYFSEEADIYFETTEGDSVYDATAPGGLKINKNEPLLWWVNKYEEYHGITAPIPMKTEIGWSRDSLKIDDLTIRLHRTLRVPDGDSPSDLPLSLGTFPIFSVSQFGSRVPESVKKRGGFIIPMFRREALWIQFSGGTAAVKVSVGGVNVISGASASDVSPLKCGPQDYIVAGKQPWIDGIVTEFGVVRQFVVTDMHQGYTVEEQVTGEAKIGGLQFDVYPRRRPVDKGAFLRNSKGARMEITTATPEELQSHEFAYHWKTGCRVHQGPLPNRRAWTLADYKRRFSPDAALEAKYIKGTAGYSGHIPPKKAQLGLSVGGKIKQRVYRDEESVRVYNEELSKRFHIHIVSPEFWEELTGVLPPITPITREMYTKHGIPWFTLFDDYVDSITEVSQALAAVRSVSQIDKAKRTQRQDALIDPNSPPFCPQHRQNPAVCVFRPCGHAVCYQCLGFALMGGSKCGCDSPIAKFVGVKRPVAQVTQTVNVGEGDGDEESKEWVDWNVEEIEQLSLDAVQAGKVVVIHLDEDKVAPLQQSQSEELNGPLARMSMKNFDDTFMAVFQALFQAQPSASPP